MRNKLILFLMLALFGSTSFLRADELTVHDGTATNGYVPVYGFYADAYLKCEMVYPAAELADMAGGEINSMKFYASQASVNWGVNFQVFVAEVANASIDAFAGPGTMVYEGALSIVDGVMEVNFTAPYSYQGGNLLVGVYSTTNGSYATSTWVGETVTNASVQGYSYSSLAAVEPTQRNFLPKTTFTYGSSLINTNIPEFTAWTMGNPDVEMTTLNLLYPGDGDMNVANPIFLQWTTDPNAAEYKIEFGSTYPPAVLVDWTAIDETYPAAPSYYEVTDLVLPNTHYFWRISIRNNVNTLTSDLFGFTTLMDIPTGVTATPDQIFTDESSVISWAGQGGGGGGGTLGEVILGEGTEHNNYLPTYILYNYSLTQQIYTADEIGGSGMINSISFYYEAAMERNLTFYLVNTDKASFSGASDWITVSQADQVFSGTVTTVANDWNTITLDAPFNYTGGNLALITDDNTGSWTSSVYAYAYSAPSMAIRVYSDGTNYDPYAPTSYSGTIMNVKNQLILNRAGAKDNRSLRGYNVYVDGVKVNTETISGNSYTLENLAYNMNGYLVAVTSVQDEGESLLSNPDTLFVSGYGELTGTVTEDMSGDPLAGVNITFKGTDEFGNEVQYTATTDAEGVYTIENVKAGIYNFGRAQLNSYEPRFLETPVTLAYNGTETVNFVLHTVYAPVDMVYAYEMDETTAKIQWSFNPFTPYVPTPGGGGGNTPGGGSASTFTEGFEGGMPAGWNVIDANNDGYTWCMTSAIPTTWTYYASLTLDWYRTGTNAICSGSYINGYGACTPDEYLVTNQVTLASGSTFKFWAAATDASYPADHFGVFVSDNGTSDWTMVNEWTLTAKGNGTNGGYASREGKGDRLGVWYEYTVDLSSFAGQKYIAIRHFNCNDQYIMCVDDIELTAGRGISDAAEWIGTNTNSPAADRAMWDYIYSFGGTSAGQQAVATDGINIYTASWQSTPTGGYTFYKYDLQGNFIEGFNITGATGIRDLTYDGTYFYGSSGSTNIFILDLANKTKIGQITCTGLSSRHVSYDPVRDGFWAGNWSTLALYDRNGALVQSAPAPSSAYGSGYFKDADDVEHLYLFCQPSSDVKVYDYNITTNTLSAAPVFDFATTPGYNAGISGGAFVGSYNGKICFFGNVQQDPNLIGIYELAAAAPVPGGSTEMTYTLYKKTLVAEGLAEADSIILAQGLTDTIAADFSWFNTAPGLYQYGVQVNYPVPSRNNRTVRAQEIIDFETGDFSQGNFNTAGTYPWAVVNGNGGKAMKSSNGGVASSTSTIELTFNFPSNGSISFDAECMGEGSSTIYDKCQFFIDNVQQFQYGANNPGWHNYSYEIEEGEHIFKWSYSKDSSVNPTGDYMMVDNITLEYEDLQSNDDPNTPVVWSNILPKYMQTSIELNAHVSTGTIEGTVVTFTNLRENLNYVATLDETGHIAYEDFRKGEYNLTVEQPGFVTYDQNVSIWDSQVFNIELEENFLPVEDLVVSGTGYARWTDMLPTEVAQRYHVTLEGALQGLTTDNFMQLDVDNLTVGETYTAAVAVVYSTGMSDFVEAQFVYTGCEAVETQVEDLEGTASCMNVILTWNGGTAPTPTPTPTPTPGNTWSDDFEDGALTNWTLIDADGDGDNWQNATPAAYGIGNAHSGTNCASSWSWNNYSIDPDNYMISPLCENAISIQYFVATNTGYPDHYGVYASSTGTNVSDFGLVFEETAGSKGVSGVKSSMTQAGTRDMSAWIEKNIPLPTGTKYVAFRHFNSYDMNYLFIDDVTIAMADSKNMSADAEWVGTNIASQGNADEMWDLIHSFSLTSAGQQGIATDGNFIYTCSWQATPTGGYNYYKYDMQGNFIEGFNIAGGDQVRDLTYDGEYFYGSSGSSAIYILDLANQTKVGQINCSGLTARHCTYDPVRDAFWAGNWSTLALYDRTGALIQSAPAPSSAYGSGYFKDADDVEHLYLFCQPSSDVKVYDYNITTNTLSAAPVFDFATTPGYNAGISGGAFVGNYSGKACFFGNVQQDPNLVGIYELGAAQGGGTVTGGTIQAGKFNIFKDGEFLAATNDNSYIYEAEDTDEHIYEVFYVDDDYNFSCSFGVTVAAGTIESVTDLDYTMVDPAVTLTWNGTAESYVVWRGLVDMTTGNVNLNILGETTEMTYTDQLPAEAGYVLYIVQSVVGECETDLQEEINNENYLLIVYDDVNEAEIVNAIYPNPTSGDLHINANGMTRISVFNALGQMVYDAEVNADEMILNMGQYNAGIYMVNIVTVNGTSVKRIVVTK